MPQYFQSTHGQIAYLDPQRGNPTLILVHGLPTAKALWKPVLPLLNPSYRAITYDLLDYGESQKIGRPISHKARADVLEELRRSLGLETFVLVAHDLGCSVAIDYMGKYGVRVSKLVLMSPPVYPDFEEPRVVKLTRAPRLGEALLKIARKPLLAASLRRGMVHKDHLTAELLQAFAAPFADQAGQAALLRNLRWGRPHETFADYPAIIRSIQAPTLIMQGCEDPYIPADQATRLQADIPASTRLAFIEDGGHFLPIDTPETVAAEINAFVG